MQNANETPRKPKTKNDVKPQRVISVFCCRVLTNDDTNNKNLLTNFRWAESVYLPNKAVVQLADDHDCYG